MPVLRTATPAGPEMWFDNVGYNVDLGSLHKEFSDVDWQDFSQWAESQSWEFL